RLTSLIQRLYTVKRYTPESKVVCQFAQKQYGVRSYGRTHRSSTRSPVLQPKTSERKRAIGLKRSASISVQSHNQANGCCLLRLRSLKAGELHDEDGALGLRRANVNSPPMGRHNLSNDEQTESESAG